MVTALAYTPSPSVRSATFASLFLLVSSRRGISAMMTFLGLGFGVSIFVLSDLLPLAHFCASRDLWKVRTNIDALKKYL